MTQAIQDVNFQHVRDSCGEIAFSGDERRRCIEPAGASCLCEEVWDHVHVQHHIRGAQVFVVSTCDEVLARTAGQPTVVVDWPTRWQRRVALQLSGHQARKDIQASGIGSEGNVRCFWRCAQYINQGARLLCADCRRVEALGRRGRPRIQSVNRAEDDVLFVRSVLPPVAEAVHAVLASDHLVDFCRAGQEVNR